jgi:hypothetical protein
LLTGNKKVADDGLRLLIALKMGRFDKNKKETDDCNENWSLFRKQIKKLRPDTLIRLFSKKLFSIA